MQMRRRHALAGLIALLALTSAAVFGLALPVQAAPTSIEFTTTSGNALIYGPITGTVDWGGNGGSVYLDVTNSAGITRFCETSTYAYFDTNWSCSVDLQYGDNTITAYAEQDSDPGNPISTASPITITHGSTQPIVISSPASGSVSNTLTPAFSGSGPHMGNVTVQGRPVSSTGPFSDVCGPVAVGEDGLWDCTATFPGEGDFTVQAVGTLLGGLTATGSAQQSLTVDIPAEVTISAPSADADVTWMAGNFLTISGSTTDSVSPVLVYLDSSETPECTATFTSATTWSCNVDLLAGPHVAAARQDGDEHSVPFDVILPEPEVSFADKEFDLGTTDAHFVGQTTYLPPSAAAASTRVEVHTNSEGWPGTVLLSTECPNQTTVSVAGFDCELDLSSLGSGWYFVTYTHFLEGQPGIGALTANRWLYLNDPSYHGPAVNCAFQPGGVSITSPDDIVSRIYAATPTSDDSGTSLAPQGYCSGSMGYLNLDAEYWTLEAHPVSGTSNECGSSCALDNLAPGVYDIYYHLSDSQSSSSSGYQSYDYLFRIPEAPTVTATGSSTSSVALSGNATTGDTVRIVNESGGTLCTTTTNTGGTWTCMFTKSSAASARAISVDPQSGGLSVYSASVSIPVSGTPPTPPADLPTLALTPVTPDPPAVVQWLLTFDGDLMNLKPSDIFTLNISAMPQGTLIEIWMHSTPHLLGSTMATGLPMSISLVVPEDIESGSHLIELLAVTPLGEHQSNSTDAFVIGSSAPGEEPSEEQSDDPETTGGGSGGGSGGASADRNDPGAPSALTASLAPVAQVAANPVTVAIAGGLALALLFLVALPTELLNSSLSSNSSRLGRVYGTVDRALTKAQDWLIRVTRSRALAAALLVVVVAIIYGFVDPGFGFDIVSLRLVLSLGIAFFVLSFVASWISGIIIRRAWGAIGVVAMQPTIILFAVVGVIVARILEFSPGFLVGVAIGLELVQANRYVTARAVFVQLGVVTGLALAAWVVYSLFTPGNDFAGMLVEDTMVAVTAEGLTGALIAVFPLKFLDGRDLWEVSKRLWVAAFLIVATAFALLVLPTAIEGTNVADYGVWLLVFAVFGLVSLAVWLIFVRADRTATASEREKVDV